MQAQPTLHLIPTSVQQAVAAATGAGLVGHPHAALGMAAVQMGPATPPCSTLFIANLGPLVSEEELREVFRSFPGFCRLRLHNKNGSPVAFVEYADVRQAAQALNSLQGFVLLSSDRGGIRIEYAKNKMGEVPTPSSLPPPAVSSPFD